MRKADRRTRQTRSGHTWINVTYTEYNHHTGVRRREEVSRRLLEKHGYRCVVEALSRFSPNSPSFWISYAYHAIKQTELETEEECKRDVKWIEQRASARRQTEVTFALLERLVSQGVSKRNLTIFWGNGRWCQRGEKIWSCRLVCLLVLSFPFFSCLISHLVTLFSPTVLSARACLCWVTG